MNGKYKKITLYMADDKLSIETTKDYLDSILENSRDIIYRYNLKTETCDFVSASVESLTGYTPQEAYQQGVDLLLQNLHPEDKTKFARLYSGLLNNTISDSTVRLKYQFRHKNETYVWHDHLISIIRDEAGEIQATIGIVRDITSQKMEEQKLKASQERFKGLSEATFEGICIHEDGRILDGNQNLLEMFGMNSVDEFIGANCFEYIAPEYHELVRQRISTGAEGPYEVFALKKDGSTFPIQVRARDCQWNGKQVRIAAFRDLTEQYQLEQELNKSKNRFKHLFENAPDAIFVADAETGIILETNSKASELLGIPCDEIVGIHQTKVHPPEEIEKYREIFQRHIQNQSTVINENIYVQHKNGEKIPVQISASVTSIDNQKVIFGIFRNVAEQKQLELQLKESEQLHKELYQNAKAGLYRTRTHDGKLLACSTALARMHGYQTVEECLERHHGTDHYVDKNRRKQLLDKLNEKKRVEDFEYQIRRPDGTTAWLSLSAEIFPEKGWIEGIVKDITPSKMLTPTEMKILKILLTGKSNKEIARGLGRSVRTIEDHRAHIMLKLNVSNVVELTRQALECGIKPNTD